MAGVEEAQGLLRPRPASHWRRAFAFRRSRERSASTLRGQRHARGPSSFSTDHELRACALDLASCDHIWVLFWFHLNEAGAPKVLPPRSTKARGVFSTRSPHRPESDRLVGAEARVARGSHASREEPRHASTARRARHQAVRSLRRRDPDRQAGWLDARDPQPAFDVFGRPLATRTSELAAREHDVDLAPRSIRALALGPEPHPYRSIRKKGEGSVLAVKDWRVHFHVDARVITVDSIATGYRARDLASSKDSAVAVHRAFVARFGEVRC